MKKLPSFSQFINESRESNWDILKDMFEAIKKSGNSTIKTPLDYQNFDKEMFFDLVSNGVNYRVHYDAKNDNIMLTNMDNNESEIVDSANSLLTQLN